MDGEKNKVNVHGTLNSVHIALVILESVCATSLFTIRSAGTLIRLPAVIIGTGPRPPHLSPIG